MCSKGALKSEEKSTETDSGKYADNLIGFPSKSKTCELICTLYSGLISFGFELTALSAAANGFEVLATSLTFLDAALI